MFGLAFGKQLVEVTNGRILPLPTIAYANGTYAPQNRDVGAKMLDGGWNMIQRVCLEAKELKSWVFLNCSRTSPQDVQVFVKMMVTTMTQMGMRVAPPQIVALGNTPVRQTLQRLCDEIRVRTKAKPDLIMCLLPDSGRAADDLYCDIKEFGNVTFGVPTQCMLDRKVSRSKLNLSDLCISDQTAKFLLQ